MYIIGFLLRKNEGGLLITQSHLDFRSSSSSPFEIAPKARLLRSDVAGCASACLRLYDDAACQALSRVAGRLRSEVIRIFMDDDGFPNDFGGGELIRVKA